MIRKIAVFTGIAGLSFVACAQESTLGWKVHDPERPAPPVVDPGAAGDPVPAPSDAIVLFDGSDFSEWRASDGSEPKWKLVGDRMQVVPGGGDIETVRKFGDVQLHIEFKADPDSTRSGQSRSNSGVFFGPYEVQVLDSYENETYADGSAASIYGQYPPLVNASRAPGEWQTYDIVYRAPEFSDDGEVLKPARITVFHNNVLVQDSEELLGATAHRAAPSYRPHGEVSIRLQDHRDDPIEFRNIWVRELKPRPAKDGSGG
ncbi:MAG TPA: DUF1080 domain-containing protein [Opitutales bacterium]|nr:DUF1080 domain-containing protein [Opitutales bacterium]